LPTAAARASSKTAPAAAAASGQTKERKSERKKLIRATPTFPFSAAVPNNDGDEAVKVACAVKYACIAGRIGVSTRRHPLQKLWHSLIKLLAHAVKITRFASKVDITKKLDFPHQILQLISEFIHSKLVYILNRRHTFLNSSYAPHYRI
jgi:hypothetical protein